MIIIINKFINLYWCITFINMLINVIIEVVNYLSRVITYKLLKCIDS